MQTLGNAYLTEHQFAEILGKMRLYQCLPPHYQKSVPKLLITDTQINSVAKAYMQDENFGSFGNDLSMWKFYRKQNSLTLFLRTSKFIRLRKNKTKRQWQRLPLAQSP